MEEQYAAGDNPGSAESHQDRRCNGTGSGRRRDEGTGAPSAPEPGQVL